MTEENGKIIFQKKEYVFAEGLGVCKVEEVTTLSAKNGIPTQYYGLRSQRNKTTTAYFPVEDHEVKITPLISKEEAEKIISLSEDEKKELDADRLFEAEFVVSLPDKNNKQKK